MGNFATFSVWVHAWLLFAHASATLAFYFPPSLVPARRGRTCRIESASENVCGASSTDDLGSPRRTPWKISSKKIYPHGARWRTGKAKGESRSRRLHMAETSMDGAVNLQEADTNVLVPVSDVVDVSLSDLSRAAADTLVGSLMGDDGSLDSVEFDERGSNKIARRTAIDRFCKTLESVYRTEFMARIGEVKAAHVLDGKRLPVNKKTHRAPYQIDRRTRTLDKNTPKKSLKRSRSGFSRSYSSGVVGREAMETNPFSIRREWWKPRRSKKEDTESPTEVKDDRKSGLRTGRDRSRAVRRRQGSPTSKDQAHRLREEEECLPLLQLVEDLLRDAMFNPISERDVMMSQALAAEFPTTARVRPDFGRLANVFDLLHERPQWTSWDPGRDSGSDADSTVAAGRHAMVPFGGLLLMFKRGNAVEETKGRLLLKKLDYIQLICLEASLSTPTEQGEGNTTTMMEMRLTLDGEVSVNKTVEGLRGTVLDAVVTGHNVFTDAVFWSAKVARQSKGYFAGLIIDALEFATTAEGMRLVARDGFPDPGMSKGHTVGDMSNRKWSNAVRWLSQSLTDTIKRRQDQAAEFIKSLARETSRRKRSALEAFVERGVEFGLERDSLVAFLEVGNSTDTSTAKADEVGSRTYGRRATVSLRRYGTMDVKVELEEFSEGRGWPPSDDSWFWDSRKTEVVNGDTDNIDAPMQSQIDVSDAEEGGALGGGVDLEKNRSVRTMVLPRVTLRSILRPKPESASQGMATDVRQHDGRGNDGTTSKKVAGRTMTGRDDGYWKINGEGGEKDGTTPSMSMLSRLLSRCTIKEPTYEEVVVMYYKKPRDPFRAPRLLSRAWIAGKALKKLFSKEEMPGVAEEKQKQLSDLETPKDEDRPEALKESAQDPGLGFQLRFYRGVPLVSLNAVTPDKKVEVRPQTALRLDLTTVVGLVLVLANLRFDSPVLVVAATVSVIFFIVRTGLGYINTRIRVESFVSRDILDKTMGSNLPVLRHLAEEAVQQKSRHVALVYAALLQCCLEQKRGAEGARWEGNPGEWSSGEAVVSLAGVSRQCDAIMKACVGLRWGAEVDVTRWVREMEKLKILVRVDGNLDGRDAPGGDGDDQSLLLKLETPSAADRISSTRPRDTHATSARYDSSAPSNRPSSTSRSGVVLYRLMRPERAAEELRTLWANILEPSFEDEATEAGRDGEE